jgi:two-component system, OmpR family, sensor histidine kinase MtrB
VLRLSLRWRVAVTFGLSSLVLTGLLAVVTWHLASDYMLKQRAISATRQAEVNVRLVDDALRTGSGGLDDLLTGLSTDSDTTVVLVREGSWLSAGRRVDPAALPEPLLSPARDTASVRQRLVVGGVPVLAVALPVPAGGTFVELFPLSQLAATLRFLSLVLVAGTALSGLLGAALGLWTSRRALRPLTELTAAASRVAGGDLAARLPEQDDPDLGPLATTFNTTAGALERRVQRDARFASDVSHELRSPLTTMVNATELLSRRRGELPETAAQAVDLLGAEVHRFQRMVVDLLEISRDDQTTDGRALETLDLVELVRHVVATRPADPPELAVDGPALVVGDRRRLDRVVANLLDNADHYAGGAVRVAVSRDRGRVRLEVDDRGPGVPEPLREQVFERFARGVRGGQRAGDSGSGLGLALVAQHVVRHGGVVCVEERPGGGARFVVELPEVELPEGQVSGGNVEGTGGDAAVPPRPG